MSAFMTDLATEQRWLAGLLAQVDFQLRGRINRVENLFQKIYLNIDK